MIYYGTKPPAGDTLQMTEEHALAMWIALSASIRSRLAPLLSGNAESVTFTAFDAKMLDTACDAWLQGALKKADDFGILVRGRIKDEVKMGTVDKKEPQDENKEEEEA